jgi:pimeloyl-ACP methyl ester carboxylesterase
MKHVVCGCDSIRYMSNGIRSTRTATLEVIDKGNCTAEHPRPLLFVHGGWHGAWCWDEHFLDFFAGKGYRALALSLRGHGNSPTFKRLRYCSLDDYVDDVIAVADSLPLAPVVVGHSMGGLVTQKYLAVHDAPAGVLMGSIPPRGVGPSFMGWLRRHPWDFARAVITGRSVQFVNPPQRARELLFSATTPESKVVLYASRLNEESARAGLDALGFSLPRPERVTAKILVLGAQDDFLIGPKWVHATALAYRTEAEIFPEMGHDMMLEPGWASVAHRVHEWLGIQGL